MRVSNGATKNVARNSFLVALAVSRYIRAGLTVLKEHPLGDHLSIGARGLVKLDIRKSIPGSELATGSTLTIGAGF